MEGSIFEFLREIVLPTGAPEGSGAEDAAEERLHFAMKLQQFTAPVQAKGVEDTAFYRYHALISANDVGGHPRRPAVAPEDFHASNRRRLAEWPLESLATTTHDTKRGEDARARINVLSEMPDQWRKAVVEWMRVNGQNRTKIHGAWAPDRNDEYLFYQALLGVWPAEEPSTPETTRAPRELVERLTAYMKKAVREAKLHTSWIHEDEAYGRAVAQFVSRTLTGDTAPAFLARFLPFHRAVAHVGMVNSLAQLVLKLASPGVPDFYQGTELWDLSLVDPDNRKPVDFARRRGLLERLGVLVERIEAGHTAEAEISRLLDRWHDGAIKFFVTASGLRFRRSHASALLEGSYLSLEATGPGAPHIVAFGRVHASGALLALVPRLVLPLVGEDRRLPLGPETWGATQVRLPEALQATRYRHVLTGEIVERSGSHLMAAAVFRTSPVALLWAPAGA
jgi:(1->4)-alpha-D-glucan 1-alpha-D-glucosylmutase